MEGMEDNDISTFKLLLHTFAKMISIPGVQKMKHELKGHLSKDILRRVETGKDLVGLLYNNGFLNDNKLMFFKKILRNASLHELEDILTEYVARKRASSDIMIEGTKQSVDNRTQNRIDALEKTIQRQYVAINYKQEQLLCESEELSRKGIAVDVINCSIGAEEELLLEILARKKIKEKDLKKYEIHTNDVLVLISENESHRSKLIEEIAIKEAELKNLEKDLKKEKENRKNSIISMVLSETNMEKLSQIITKLRKDILNVAKERERLEYKLQHIETRRERHKDALRIINLERIAIVKDISGMEKKHIEAKESYLEQARRVGSLELEVMELMHSMEGNEAEAKETKDRGLQFQSEFLMMAFRNINLQIEAKEFHVLKYEDIDELKSFVFGELGSRLSPLQFNSPISVVFSKDDNVFILDQGNRRIVITNLLGRLQCEPILLGDVFEAVDMTINHKDQLLIISCSLVKILTNKGNLLFQFLPEAEPNEPLPELTGIAVNVDNDIFLCDAVNKKIQCFSENGTFKRFIRLRDTFYSPNKLTVIGKTELVVSDDMDSDLKVVDLSSENVTRTRRIGNEGVCLGEFLYPNRMTVDRDNNLLVVDSGNHRIQVFDAQKHVMTNFGRLGSKPGCLDTPTGIAVHPYGIVAVADSKNNRVVLYN